MTQAPALDVSTMAVRLGSTLFFVLLNGFFVAAEFALVKVRETRMQWLDDRGNSRARVALHMLGKLDLYLSACQFGITVSSLILGGRVYLASSTVRGYLVVAEGPPCSTALSCSSATRRLR